mgnify:CR=1 FL=1
MDNDPELLSFHRQHVDKNYKTKKYEVISFWMDGEKRTSSYEAYSSTRGTNPLYTLEVELKKLALPSAVYYALMTLGTSVVVSLSDGGTITVSDFYALILAAGSVAVLTVYWDAVEPVYPQIVKSFKLSFADLITIVETAFLITREDVREEKAIARVEVYVKKLQYKVSFYKAKVKYGSGALVNKTAGEISIRKAVQRVMS